MSYLDTIQAKKQARRDDDEKKAYNDSLNSVSEDIRTLLASLETSGAKKLDKQVVDAISSLGAIVAALNGLKVDGDDETKQTLNRIADILSRLDVRPVVNVPKAQVTINERDIDFDPLIQSLNAKEVPDDDPLIQYKAQDINDDDPNIQYVGFVNPEGNWYIIENSGSSLRYKFGKKGYINAFKDAAKLSYKLYSEAIREVKT